MTWHLTPYGTTLIVTAAVSLMLSLYSWGRRTDRTGTYFALLMLAVSAWSVATGLESAAPGAAPKILFAKLQYIGIVSVAPLWLLFALSFSRLEGTLSRLQKALLWVIPAGVLALAATNDLHGLVWPRITPLGQGPDSPLVYDHGPAFWSNAVYAYALVALGTYAIIRTAVRAARQFRGQAVMLIAGALAPWLGNVLYLSRVGPFKALDLTPVAFMVSGLFATWGIFRFRFLALVPVAHETLFASMTDGVISADEEGRIIAANPAARALVGLPKDVAGLTIREAFARWPHYVERFRGVMRVQEVLPTGTADDPGWVELRITPLVGEQGRIHGRLLVLRDVTEQKLAEDARRRSEEHFRLVVENAPDAIFIQTDGRFAFVNPAACRLMGASTPDDLLGRPVLERFHPDYRETVAERIRALNVDRTAVPTLEEVYLRLDGSSVDVEVAGVPIVFGGRDGALVFVRDITERMRVERALRASDEEKSVLLKEIHHRVKNNMQVISSMLSLQSRDLGDPGLLEVFRDTQTRIRSMALVHEKLYQSRDLARVDFPAYLQSLVVHLFHSRGVDPSRVRYELEVEEAALDINTAIPLGLIVSELLSNALKYAFPGGRTGSIRIGLDRAPSGRRRLTVADDGIGLPEGFDIRASSSLGLQIVTMLVEQLDASLEVVRAGGTEFRIEFPEVGRRVPA